MFLNDYRKSLWRINLTIDVYIILFYYCLQMDQVSYCLSHNKALTHLLENSDMFIFKFYKLFNR